MSSDDYRPSTAVLQKLKGYRLVVVLGPSAAGKTTVIRAAIEVEPQIHMVVGDTSRDPRPGESEGIEYHFCQLPDMQEQVTKQGYIIVERGLHDHIYALNPARFADNKVNARVLWADDMPYIRSLPFKQLKVLYLVPPSYEVWQERFAERNFQPDEAKRRLAEAKRSLHFALNDQDVHLIIGTTLELAREDFISLALGKPLSARLQGDQSRARELIQQLLKRL